jgi:hypothetical protein
VFSTFHCSIDWGKRSGGRAMVGVVWGSNSASFMAGVAVHFDRKYCVFKVGQTDCQILLAKWNGASIDQFMQIHPARLTEFAPFYRGEELAR